jgi:hypothetical protein
MDRDRTSDRFECRADERSSESVGRGPNDAAVDLTSEENELLSLAWQQIEQGCGVTEEELLASLNATG